MTSKNKYDLTIKAEEANKILGKCSVSEKIMTSTWVWGGGGVPGWGTNTAVRAVSADL